MNLQEEIKYIENYISNMSEEEFIETLKECGYSFETKKEEDAEEYNHYIINELFGILEELDARNISTNSIYEQFHGLSWTELCKKGIELFEQIK